MLKRFSKLFSFKTGRILVQLNQSFGSMAADIYICLKPRAPLVWMTAENTGRLSKSALLPANPRALQYPETFIDNVVLHYRNRAHTSKKESLVVPYRSRWLRCSLRCLYFSVVIPFLENELLQFIVIIARNWVRSMPKNAEFNEAMLTKTSSVKNPL